MNYSKVVKRSSLLLSTVFSVFCIGCSQNSIDALTQAPIGKSNSMTVKAVEDQNLPETDKIEAPKGKAIKLYFKMDANEEQSLDKKPCPPPPPPCGLKREGEKEFKPVDSAVKTSDTEVLNLKTINSDDNKKRPCPPPPSPCGLKKDGEKLGEQINKEINKDLEQKGKKECKGDRQAPPPPPQRQNGQMNANQNNQFGEQNQGQMISNNQGGNRQTPPPPPQRQNGQMNTNQNGQFGEQNQGQMMDNNQGGNRQAPPPPQSQRG
ncbi:MAG: hypothetical protein U0354_17870 [Candidatus Sericytochromatia bacterium]